MSKTRAAPNAVSPKYKKVTILEQKCTLGPLKRVQIFISQGPKPTCRQHVETTDAPRYPSDREIKIGALFSGPKGVFAFENLFPNERIFRCHLWADDALYGVITLGGP